jgi:hypothetical protein
MRLRLACAVSLIAIGGGIDNVFSPAGMYQWGTNLLIAAGVVLCGLAKGRGQASARADELSGFESDSEPALAAHD